MSQEELARPAAVGLGLGLREIVEWAKPEL
jgi:hypothetical protein